MVGQADKLDCCKENLDALIIKKETSELVIQGLAFVLSFFKPKLLVIFGVFDVHLCDVISR